MNKLLITEESNDHSLQEIVKGIDINFIEDYSFARKEN